MTWAFSNISSSVYQKSADLSAQNSAIYSLAFNSDGTKMYANGKGDTAYTYIYQYSLSVPYDIDTKTYEKYITIDNVFRLFHCMSFNDEGTKLYALSFNSLRQYSLSTPWEIDTVLYENAHSFTPEDSNTYGFYIKPDGTKIYTAGANNDNVYQYSFGTAWDAYTISYDGKNFDTLSQEDRPYSIRINPDGNKMYVMGGANNTIYQYSLSDIWDVETSTYDGINFSVASQTSDSLGLTFNADGSNFYVTQSADSPIIYQYTTVTPKVPMISSVRDANRVPAMLATLNSDGISAVAVKVNPTSHALKALDGIDGSNLPFETSQRDNNRVTTMWGVSSADGITPIPIYCDIDGNLLIQST